MSSKAMKSISAAIICAALSIGGAYAQEGVGNAEGAVPQKNVDFKDLNLASEHDARRLYTRLRGAARQVCAQFAGKSVRERMQLRECVNGALSEAVLAVNHPMLTALHTSGDAVRVAQRGKTAEPKS